MTFEQFIAQSWLLIDLLLSVLLGFIIGMERKIRLKEAGIRTHTIVCLGSALMMVVSRYAFGELSDPSRVAAQIVSGVGFLGAGIIVYKKYEVHGLTTAAGVWATAGIGMACGGQLYIIAVGGAFLMIIAQFVFHLPIPVFNQKKSYAVKIEFLQTCDENKKVKEIFAVKRFNQLVIKREERGMVYSATLNTNKEFSSSYLNEVMEANSFICSIERYDQE
jgi:putative Mg2+ transporter-C (MgtC) family protein